MNDLNGNQRVFLLTMLIVAILVAVLGIGGLINANVARSAQLQQNCQNDGGVWTGSVCSWSAP